MRERRNNKRKEILDLRLKASQVLDVAVQIEDARIQLQHSSSQITNREKEKEKEKEKYEKYIHYQTKTGIIHCTY